MVAWSSRTATSARSLEEVAIGGKPALKSFSEVDARAFARQFAEVKRR
jgi:hypothetical protein